MQTKEVYQLDSMGVLIGVTDATESPLEPGVFLIPGGCVETAPPKHKDSYVCVWDAAEQKWSQVALKEVQVVGDSLEYIPAQDVERAWRNAELARADIELNKAQDGDGVGTVKAWRDYRKSLRAWPNMTNFPDKTFRPVAPDGFGVE